LGEVELRRYSDLSPEAVALQFGEDYELQRMDADWMTLPEPKTGSPTRV